VLKLANYLSNRPVLYTVVSYVLYKTLSISRLVNYFVYLFIGTSCSFVGRSIITLSIYIVKDPYATVYNVM